MNDFDCKIIKMNIEKKYYKTAAIEFIIKNNMNFIEKFSLLNLKNIRFKYRLDFKLIEKNKILNKINCIDELIECLENNEEEFKIYDDLNKTYEQVYKTLSYEDIYINKKYDILYEIKPTFDPQLYESLLEKTWLPDVVNCFGYDIDLRKYGYRDY